MRDPLGILNDPLGIIGKESVNPLRVAGSIAGSLGLMPGAGVRALMDLLPKVSTDPTGPLLESGSLEKAGQTLEQIMSVPQELLKTPEEAETAEKIGGVMAWPFVKAGEGWGLIGEHAIDPLAEKLTGKKIPYLEPILKTGGEAAAVLSLIEAVKKLPGKTARGLSAKNLEKLGAERLAKYGPKGVVPEVADVPGMTSKGTLPPLRPPGSEFVEGEFAKRFIKKEPVEPKPVDRNVYRQGSKEGKWWSFDEEYAYTFGKKGKSVEKRILPKNIKLIDEVDLKLRPSETIDQGLERLGYDGMTRVEGQMTGPDITSVYFKSPKILKDSPDLKPKEGTTLYSGLPIHKLGEAYTKTVGTLVWDKAIMKGVPKLLEKIPGGKAVNRAFLRDYRGNLSNTETYIKSMDDMKQFQAVGREYAIDLGQRLQAHPEAAQLRMGEYIRGELETLPRSELKLAGEAKQTLYDLGRQATDLGLLSEETFFKNAGKYMPRLYTSKEYQGLLTQYRLTKPNRLDLSRFKQRKDIPKEIRQEMGEILTPGYPVAKGIAQLTHDIELSRWFNGISKNPDWAYVKGSKGAIPEGFERLPNEKKLGPLKDAYVHPEIHRDLMESIRVRSVPEKVWRKSLGYWKFGKVILSPKTHVRNVLSNGLLAHLGGMPLYEQPVYLTKAIKAMKSKGDYWQGAKKNGLLSSTFIEGELRSLFDRVEGELSGIKAGSFHEHMGKAGKVWDKMQLAGNKAAKLYEAEEQWFKMAKYIHNIERRGMNPKAASADAEKWLFNYSKLTRFQESYKNHPLGAPFSTFTFKVIPRMAEAAIKTPWRFALPAAIIWQLEEAAMNMTGETKEQFKAKRKLRPDWMQGHFLGIPNFARVPLTDETGRDYNLNLTYMTPWGDIGESGGAFGIPGGIMPFSQPFTKEPIQQLTNYDWFWKEPIVKESAVAGKSLKEKIKTQAVERGKHLAQTMLPTPAIDISKMIDAARGAPDYKGRERPGIAVAADVFGGVKMYPVDYIDQLARKVSKIDPQKGQLAQEIAGEIRTLTRKKIAQQKKGENVSSYDLQIKSEIDQLKGMGKELKKYIETYKKATGK